MHALRWLQQVAHGVAARCVSRARGAGVAEGLVERDPSLRARGNASIPGRSVAPSSSERVEPSLAAAMNAAPGPSSNASLTPAADASPGDDLDASLLEDVNASPRAAQNASSKYSSDAGLWCCPRCGHVYTAQYTQETCPFCVANPRAFEFNALLGALTDAQPQLSESGEGFTFARAALPAIHEIWSLFEIVSEVCDREHLWMRVYGDIAVVYAPGLDEEADDLVLMTQSIGCSEQMFYASWSSWGNVVNRSGAISKAVRSMLVLASEVNDRREQIQNKVRRNSSAAT